MVEKVSTAYDYRTSTKGKKMTTSTKTPKAVTSADVVNSDLCAQLEAVINLEAELSVWAKMTAMLEAGTISVRGGKATLEKAEEKGMLPTMRVSQVQYFVPAKQVRSLKGGENKSLKETLNVTIQAKRAFGKEFADKLESAETFAEFAKSVPSQGERAKAGRKSAPKTDAVTADAVISLAFGLWKDLDTHEIADIETAQKFAEQLVKAITYNKRKNHPSTKTA